MYKIDESKDRENFILLVPAMLDAHFPLLRFAFYSKNYRPVILENEEGVTDVGLTYVNNDMCYPAILTIGQMISALQSGAYDLNRTKLLMPTAGDACRGSNYTGALRRAVHAAGLHQVQVLSLNVRGLEKSDQMQLEPGMVWRALFGLFYGDMLMLLTNQVLPYEVHKGETQTCRQRWIDELSDDLKNGKNLSLNRMKKNFYRMAEAYAKIEKSAEKKQRIGIVGELYIKYCHLGNWNLEKTLLEFSTMKKEAEGYVNYRDTIGDGWLIGAETVSHILHDCRKVAAVQPFACMPNQICGRGLYPSLSRKLPQGQIVSVDVDASASKLNAYNRIKMLIDSPK